jgi:Kef-type K+ transport system membrane component KefB/Trk K+ transport system NAD-binding subunit
LVTGLIQVTLTVAAGFLLANYLLGFSFLASVYIAIALAFSSTIIITKVLSDKAELESLHGKIAVGILILQDLIVIFILMALPYFSGTATTLNVSYISLIYGVLAIIALVFASIYVPPNITKFIARNQELLFLFSVGWCFLLAFLFYKFGFSMEIGALLAGMSLSVSPYHTEIASKIRPLRDFFVVIFFVLLGLQLGRNIESIAVLVKPALILAAFVLLFKFFVIIIPLGIFGYSKRTGFLTGTSLGQVSVFSFIMVALGVSLGHISQEISSIVILTGLFTIAFSTYMMNYSKKIYPLLARPLSIFEKKHVKEREIRKKKYNYILFGYNRIGFSVLKSLQKTRKKYLVVDFNPDTTRKLQQKGINTIYGDADDTEFLRDIGVDKAKLVLSTIPDYEINLLILNDIRKTNQKSIVILTAHQIADALKFYSLGADYVILPHFLGGSFTAKLIEKAKTKKKLYKKEKEKQIKSLKERLEEGHEHPIIEKNHS